MLIQFFNAKLEGYEGPFFPAEIETINENFRRSGINKSDWFKEFDRYLPTIVGITRPATSDGYEWFGAITFNAEQGFIVVTFPHVRDTRSIAFYHQGEIAPGEIEKIVSVLIEKMARIPKVVGTSRKYVR